MFDCTHLQTKRTGHLVAIIPIPYLDRLLPTSHPLHSSRANKLDIGLEGISVASGL